MNTSMRILMSLLLLILITTAFSIMGPISSAHAADPNLPGTDAPAADLAKLYNAANAADIAYQTAKARAAEADTELLFDSSLIVQTAALSARA
jgi:hypothetical protein